MPRSRAIAVPQCTVCGHKKRRHDWLPTEETPSHHHQVGIAQPQRLDAQRAFVNLCDYFRELVATRRGGSPGTDLLSLLLEEEASGDRLSQRELVATLVMLVGAGHTTTARFIPA